MQSSRLNQAEICQGQDSIRHSISEVIQSFGDKITHGPEYTCTFCDHLWFRPSVSKGAFLLSELAGQTISLQRKCNNLKQHLHDNPSHSSAEDCISSSKSVNLKARCKVSPSKCLVWPVSSVKWKTP